MIASRPPVLLVALVLLCCSATMVRAGFLGCPSGYFNIGSCISSSKPLFREKITYENWIGGGEDDANCNRVCSEKYTTQESGTGFTHFKGGCCSALSDECFCY